MTTMKSPSPDWPRRISFPEKLLSLPFLLSTDFSQNLFLLRDLSHLFARAQDFWNSEESLTYSLVLAVFLTLLLLHVPLILILPWLRLKLPILPLDSRLQFNNIGSEAATNRPRWLSFSLTDPLSSGAIPPC
jgi:hypothetical protein